MLRFGITRRTPPDPKGLPKEAHDPEWHQRLLDAVPGLVLVRHTPPVERMKPYLLVIVECEPETEFAIRRHLGSAFHVGVDDENLPLLLAHIQSTGLTVDEYYDREP